MKISKELLLKETNGGLDFYRLVIGDLKSLDSNRMENVKNPFYCDTKAALSIYKKDDNWLFNDYGDPEYRGDVFKFAAFYYNLDGRKDFYKILQNIMRDLSIDGTKVGNNDPLSDSEYALLKTDGYILRPADEYGGYKKAGDYFFQYGITESTLREYSTIAVKSYITKKEETQIITEAKPDQYIIAYQTADFAKIYTPHPKGFRYVGKKSTNYVFGVREILLRNGKTRQARPYLIITGGEKDVLTLASLGYDAISLNSETGSLPKFIVDELFPSYDKVIVLYDNDFTGKKMSMQLAAKYHICRIELPDELIDKGGKDISDFVKLQMSADKIKGLVENAQPMNEEANIEASDVDTAKCYNNNEISTADPLIPDSVYDNLPDFLKQLFDLFGNNKRRRDIVLLSVLTTLSTCFPKIKGIYDQKKVGLNFFTLITAPASAGKGVANWAEKLVSGIVTLLKQVHIKEHAEYRKELHKYNKKKKDDPTLEEPEEPQERSIIIPGNSSTTKMIDILAANKDFGLIFETETDTLNTVLKTEWGDFTAIIRQAFHHERIALGRVSRKKICSIDSPHLSAFLTGTPNQLDSLIKDVENGFCSRILYYTFKHTAKWEDPFGNKVSLDDIFNDCSNIVTQWWKKMDKLSYNSTVTISQTQQQKFSEYFSSKLKSLNMIWGDEIVANVFRMGLNHYRIAMLLTIVRYMETGKDLPETLEINDDDFQTAFSIVDCLFVHLVTVFNRLSRVDKRKPLRMQIKKLYDTLPDEFSRKEYNGIADGMGINSNTADKYNKDLERLKYIERLKHGSYVKLAA